MTAVPKPVSPSVNGWNAEYLEAEYQRWKRDPAAVPPDLRQFFLGFDLAGGRAPRPDGQAAPAVDHLAAKQLAVNNLIEAHRRVGHLAATIDPFGRTREGHPSLDPSFHGLTDADMRVAFHAGALSPDGSPMPLVEILEALRATYCGPIGVELGHITGETERRWLTDRLERIRGRAPIDQARRAEILRLLHRAELFERFCGKRFPGVKRFSLEGGDTLIPLLERVLERASDHGAEEVVMGMAHRGRLNVLTNIIGKTYEEVFTEFEDAWSDEAVNGGGDVKYHKGYSSNRVLAGGKNLWVVMASNPSHLESVNAVVLGRTRAKQRLREDYDRRLVVPVLIHGDAAFIAQGVVAETLNLSQLEGYHVGGTIHVVVNNLIGFTTGEEDARSSRYCTDIAKMLEIPILHVNGEDPEAAVFAAELAADYRAEFKQDVVIDLVCYRRHGHNESDEAAFTQPLLYKEIKDKPSVLKTYAEKLLAEEVIDEAEMEKIRRSLDETLDKAYANVQKAPVDPTPDPGRKEWAGMTDQFSFDPVETGVARETLDRVAQAMGRWPEGFTPHPKLVKVLHDRARCVRDDLPIDWATAENLAVGSLLLEGHVVRLTGQDSRRGTFSQRHAALRDVNTSDLFVPLSHLNGPPTPDMVRKHASRDARARALEARHWVYDSPLSEYAVLAYEYGYSLASPNILVMWEAQFGDFCNGAQTIIDEYLAAAAAKWQRWSGLVLLLPHGYEGQGPDHSSARLERFLQLAADNNMQVCHPTTPAQYFHLLRRQVHPKRRFRKPLIVLTPKSLLRLPAAASRVEELTTGTFQEVLDDPRFAGQAKSAKKDVRTLILCSGKVYYDLAARREETGRADLAFLRLEQLYPLHTQVLHEMVASYPKEVELVWVQEEPKNMGAYQFVFMNVFEEFAWELPYIGRPASATPATGSPSRHAEQLDEFLTDAVGPSTKPVAAAH